MLKLPKQNRGWGHRGMKWMDVPAGGTTASLAGAFLAGALFGAAAMYMLDPNMGRRRRALTRDQIVHAQHQAGDLGAGAQGKAEDLRNRTQGTLAEARGTIASVRS